jgi:hypothetical protein
MDHGTRSFKVGGDITLRFSFPPLIKRLLFMMGRNTQPGKNLMEQAIENPSMECGIAEVIITAEATRRFGEGVYNWHIFAVATDGTRDTTFPFSMGQIVLKGDQKIPTESDHNILPSA